MNINDRRSFIIREAHIIARAMRMTDPTLDYRTTFGAAMRELWAAQGQLTTDWYYHRAATKVMQHYESMRQAGWAEPRRYGFIIDDRLFASEALLVRMAYAYQARHGFDPKIDDLDDFDIYLDPRTHRFGGSAPAALIDYAASQYSVPREVM